MDDLMDALKYCLSTTGKTYTINLPTGITIDASKINAGNVVVHTKAKFDVGDKVYAGECEAIVTQVLPGNYMVDGHTAYSYEIAYSDTRLGRCIITENKLTKESVRQYNEPRYKIGGCTCGVDSVGEGRHSDWCDKWNK